MRIHKFMEWMDVVTLIWKKYGGMGVHVQRGGKSWDTVEVHKFFFEEIMNKSAGKFRDYLWFKHHLLMIFS